MSDTKKHGKAALFNRIFSIAGLSIGGVILICLIVHVKRTMDLQALVAQVQPLWLLLAGLCIPFSESVDAPVEAGQVLGILTIRYDGTEYGRLDLVADTAVERSDFLYYKHQVETFFQNAGVRLLLVVVLVFVVIVLLRVLVFRKRRRYRSGVGMGAGRRGHYSGRRRR